MRSEVVSNYFFRLSHVVVIPASETSPESLLLVCVADSGQARMTTIYFIAEGDLISYFTKLA